MSTDLESLTDESVQSLLQTQTRPFLVAFWAPWANSCQGTPQLLQEMAKDYANSFKVYLMNVDDNAHTPALLGISSIPTFVLFEQGKKSLSLNGPMSRLKLSEQLDRYLTEGKRS